VGFVSDILDAHAEGRAAAERGDRRSTCPHDPDSSDPRTRNMWTSWMRGYASVTPTPVDYSG
jgi:hypothetical protein